MYAFLVIAALATLWAWKTGKLRRADAGDVAALLGVVLGFRWLATGHFVLAIACFAAVAGWAAFRSQQMRRARMPLEEARELLGVSADADQAAIRAAHRRLIARVHPDSGGSTELARRVNAARDILLSDARARPSQRRE